MLREDCKSERSKENVRRWSLSCSANNRHVSGHIVLELRGKHNVNGARTHSHHSNKLGANCSLDFRSRVPSYESLVQAEDAWRSGLTWVRGEGLSLEL